MRTSPTSPMRMRAAPCRSPISSTRRRPRFSGLAATDAKYGFMTDFVNVLRSMGEFEILLDPASREAWYARVETWFREHPDERQKCAFEQ